MRIKNEDNIDVIQFTNCKVQEMKGFVGVRKINISVKIYSSKG